MAIKVAVIGAGGLGLSATKNFLEDGFDVTTYESRDYVGGLVSDNQSSPSYFHFGLYCTCNQVLYAS